MSFFAKNFWAEKSWAENQMGRMVDWAEKCKLAEKKIWIIFADRFSKNVDFKHKIECQSIASYFIIVFSEKGSVRGLLNVEKYACIFCIFVTDINLNLSAHSNFAPTCKKIRKSCQKIVKIHRKIMRDMSPNFLKKYTGLPENFEKILRKLDFSIMSELSEIGIFW
jgi:hypothetical protein